MDNWEKAKLIADKFGVLQKENGDINDDVLLAIESALSQHYVSGRSEQLVCDACGNQKPTTNRLEDCACKNGYMWVKQTNCC